MTTSDARVPRTIPDSLTGARFVKVTGPAGDWLVFPPTTTTPPLTPEHIVAICNRHSGAGATGVVALTVDKHQHAAELHHIVAWHADGSLVHDMTEPGRAATSGLAAYGIIDARSTSHHTFTTADGLVTTVFTPAYVGVDLGQWNYVYPETATAAGSDALVMAAGLADPRPGLTIRLQQNHINIAVETREELEAIDVSQEPSIEPAPEDPTTVGFVVPQDPLIVSGMGQLMMRASDNLSESALSSAAAAASVAFQQWSDLQQLKVWNIDTPAGEIVVQLHDQHRVSTFAHVSPVYFGAF